MRESYKRCTHCRDVYLIVLSGHSPRTEHTDGRFCPDCLKVVQEALSKVPRKFEQVWEPTTDVRVEQLLAMQSAGENAVRATGGIVARRVSAPLFNLETGEVSKQGYVQGQDNFAGRHFHYRYWEGKEDEAEVTEEFERNLATGELRPWRNF